MDPALFKEQRRCLLEMAGEVGGADAPDEGHRADLLDGLTNMLDDLADYGHDVLGMDCLLEERRAEGGGE